MGKGSRRPAPRLLYQHSPNVIEKFGPEDLHTSYYPLPGIDFHNNPQLAQFVEQYGKAPDALFRSGMAAPPLGKNESGLRHYTADFLGDPAMVMNLDAPISAQQPGVREMLERMGIRDRSDAPGYRDDTAEALWLDALRQHGGYENTRLSDLDELVDPSLEGPASLQNIAEFVASGDPGADSVRNQLAPIVLDRLSRAGIPAASRMGSGWGAGSAFAPSSVGKSPFQMLLDEAQSARADGDIGRAQEIENVLAGDEPGDLYGVTVPEGGDVPAPSGGTREYKVFDPNAINIRRVASILAAMGLGGATASADDRYGDQASGFASPPPEPASESSPWGAAPAGPGGAPTPMPEGEAGTVFDYLQNRLVDEDLVPEDMQQFQAAPPEAHAEFRKNFDEAMRMPVVRLADSVTTPEAYIQSLIGEYGSLGYISPDAAENVKRSLQGLPYDETDQVAYRVREALLDQMRDTLPSGSKEYGWEPGATPRQLAAMGADGAGDMNARYRLTSEGQQGFQAERVLNLFSTFQNGRHRPVFADVGSRVAGIPAAAFGGNWMANENLKLAGNRFNTPEGRLNESLYWWNRGRPDGTAADSFTGAKYPSLSSTTMEGITTKLDSTDNFIPLANQGIFEQAIYNRDLSPDQFSRLMKLRNNQLRSVTPINPEGAKPEDLRRLRRDLRDFQANSRGWANAYAPFVTKHLPSPEAWAGYPAEKIPEVKPTFLPPAYEMAANLPTDYLDMQTVLGLGAAMRPGLFGHAATGLAQDLPQELGTGLAFTSVNTRNDAGGETPGLFDPQKTSLVTYNEGPRMGFPVPADDPNYGRYYEDARGQRKNVLRDILDRGTKLYGSQPTATSRP